MGEFFRGWRRKTGLVTLSLACVLTAGWVRSLTRTDQWSFVAFQKYECFASTAGRIEWASWKREEQFAKNPYGIRVSSGPRNDSPSPFTRKPANSIVGLIKDYFVPINSAPYPDPIDVWENLWLRRGSHFGGIDRRVRRHFAVPYWIVVLTLTLVSANFLLAKPHPAKPKNVTEPTPIPETAA